MESNSTYQRMIFLFVGEPFFSMNKNWMRYMAITARKGSISINTLKSCMSFADELAILLLFDRKEP